MVKSMLREAVVSELLALSQLEDAEESARCRAYLTDILSAVQEYEHYLAEVAFSASIRALCERGVRFTSVEDGASIKRLWEEKFAKRLSKEEKAEVYFDAFWWHLFSYERLQAQESDAAHDALLQCKKRKVYVFFQHTDECYRMEGAELLEEADLTNETIHDFISDFYLFDVVEGWTYVCTHEAQCGPYFYQVGEHENTE